MFLLVTRGSISSKRRPYLYPRTKTDSPAFPEKRGNENFMMQAYTRFWLSRVTLSIQNNQRLLFWLGLSVALDAGFLLLCDRRMIGDESVHVAVILGLMKGSTVACKSLAMLPVYHWMIAHALTILGVKTVSDIRLVSFFGALSTIGAFFHLVRTVDKENRLLKTCQFVFLPILFPFFFVVYTDLWALTFVFLSIQLALKNKPGFSAIAATIAVLFRTTNIAWAAFAALILIYREPAWVGWRVYLIRSRSIWPFFLLAGGFITFVFINHGIAVGTKEVNPLAFNLSNVWFFSLIFFLFEWPSCFGVIRSYSKIRGSKLLFLACVAVTLLAVYWLTYSVTHPFNNFNVYSCYLRNYVLYWTTSDPTAKTTAFILVALGLLCWLQPPMVDARLVWLAPFGLISVVTLPLIEQRYYLPAIALFMAFRKLEARKYESINLGISVVVSFCFVCLIARNNFFL